MKFIWKYRYVPEGQLEPDKYGRWAIYCYIEIDPRLIPGFEDSGESTGLALVAIMERTGNTTFDLSGEGYTCVVPSIRDALNTGLACKGYYLYSSNIDDLKEKVESEIQLLSDVFKSAR